MSETKLRNALIRLAHANPELRTDLLPLIKTAKKPHYNLTSYAKEYEDQIAMLAANNYGPWKSTQEAEAHVKKAIRDHAKELYNDVIESFGETDIKYMVEMHMYSDEPDPYDLEPPDKAVGKKIEAALKKIIGNDWASYSGTRPDNSRYYQESNKAWQVWVEGHPSYTVDSLYRELGRSLGRGFDVEVQDNVTLLVIPE